MSFEEQTSRIERLIWLIENANTGTAQDLSKKLGVSRRTIFNDFDFLKGKGYQIVYCHYDNTYRFEKMQNNPIYFYGVQ